MNQRGTERVELFLCKGVRYTSEAHIIGREEQFFVVQLIAYYPTNLHAYEQAIAKSVRMNKTWFD